MATPGPVNRSQLEANYQSPGEVYDDTKTEGAFGVLADQIDANAVVFGPNGAASVTSAVIPGLTGVNVHDQLKSLESKIQQLQDGVVPSGSITTTMIQDMAVTYAKLSPDLKAAIDAAKLWRVNNGEPEYYDGTEWVPVGQSKLYVPSSTARVDIPAEKTIVNAATATASRFLLIAKFIPQFDGEINYSAELRVNNVNNKAFLLSCANTSGRAVASGNGAGYSSAFTTAGWNYSTPNDTALEVPSDILTPAALNALSPTNDVVSNTAYQLKTGKLMVVKGQVIFFVLRSYGGVTIGDTAYVRNFKIMYDEVDL